MFRAVRLPVVPHRAYSRRHTYEFTCQNPPVFGVAFDDTPNNQPYALRIVRNGDFDGIVIPTHDPQALRMALTFKYANLRQGSRYAIQPSDAVFERVAFRGSLEQILLEGSIIAQTRLPYRHINTLALHPNGRQVLRNAYGDLIAGIHPELVAQELRAAEVIVNWEPYHVVW